MRDVASEDPCIDGNVAHSMWKGVVGVVGSDALTHCGRMMSLSQKARWFVSVFLMMFEEFL